MLTKEDVMFEFDQCNEFNRLCSDTSTHHTFTENVARAKERSLNATSHSYDGECDELVSERTRHEERRMMLIDHHTLMYYARTLK